jgi:hypothetical protein
MRTAPWVCLLFVWVAACQRDGTSSAPEESPEVEAKRAVQRDLEAQASRARVHEQEQARAQDARRTLFADGPLINLAGELLHAFAPWGDEETAAGFEAVELTSVGGAKRTRRAPFSEGGLGLLRMAFTDAIAEVLPDQAVAEEPWDKRHERANHAFNRVLRDRLGADLFDEANPGALAPAALDRLLAEIWIDPDSRLLGTQAKQLYRLYRPIVWDYVRVYRALDEHVGRGKALRELAKARKQAGADGDLLPFYEEFTARHRIAEHAGMKERWGTNVIAGFWIRRMADGTDARLIAFAGKIARGYDPELAALLGAR